MLPNRPAMASLPPQYIDVGDSGRAPGVAPCRVDPATTTGALRPRPEQTGPCDGMTTAPPQCDAQPAAWDATTARRAPLAAPDNGSSHDLFGDDFRPFPPPAALPQMSPLTSPDASACDDDAFGDAHHDTRRRCDIITDSLSDSCEGVPMSVLKPSPEAIATAFTPLREGKIERTKELMERVALVKAQFRARQRLVAAAASRAAEERLCRTD